MPLHQKIFVSRNKNIVVGAILYGCPESLQNNNYILSNCLVTSKIEILKFFSQNINF
ncbi:MAG: hypothetical protein KAI83_02345 [Thiomargarita sp.]|nr:hypothetical protein [Thiomargarita sp.]